MKTSHIIMAICAALAALVATAIGLGWIGRANSLAQNQVFSPKEEAVRREVFEQSKSYTEGMAQELRNMQRQYVQASPEHKAALRSIILHQTASVDENVLPADLRSFINELKRSDNLR